MGPKRSIKPAAPDSQAATAVTVVGAGVGAGARAGVSDSRTTTPCILNTSTASTAPLARADNPQKHQQQQQQQQQQQRQKQNKNRKSFKSTDHPLLETTQVTIPLTTDSTQTLLYELDDYIHTCIHCWLYRNDVHYASKSLGCFNDELQKSILTHYRTPPSILPQFGTPFDPFEDCPNYRYKPYVDNLYAQAYKRLLPDKTWQPPPLSYNWWPAHKFITQIFNTFSEDYEKFRKMALEKTTEKDFQAPDAQVKSADMSDEMQADAIEVATEALKNNSLEKDMAQHIKKTFDDQKGPTWHCIVGRNFGSFVTHETKHFIYFYLGHYAILLFKTQ